MHIIPEDAADDDDAAEYHMDLPRFGRPSDVEVVGKYDQTRVFCFWRISKALGCGYLFLQTTHYI